MAKYTATERAALAATGERLGLGEKRSKNVADMRRKSTKTASRKVPKNQVKRHRETDSERLERLMAAYQLKPLRRADIADDHDVTNPTRYQAVVMAEAGDLMLANALKRHAHVMQSHEISGSELRQWREHFMLMNPEQLGKLLRVAGRTVRAWETGKSRIPFSMWWVMHVTMQEPAYFLTRPGFHDFYIEYENGEALLCSYSWPDIRWTAADLYFKRSAFDEVLRLRGELKLAEEKIQEFQNENTSLRQMFKTNAVSTELQLMHDHIGQLMQRINTADVVSFQLLPTQSNLSSLEAAA